MFQNKTVWITGASSGIGEALAIEFARLGANVVLSARNREALARVADNCAGAGKTLILPLDLAQTGSFAPAVEKVLQTMGRIDILVNNAGISQRSLVKDTDLSVYEKLIRVNLLGTIALTKAVLPHFIENQSGHFVVVTSMAGKFATPLRSGYAASKHGLHGFFNALRLEHHDDHIRVMLITPGFVRTNISLNALTADGSKQNKMDAGQAKGIPPEVLAKKIIRDLRRGKNEVAYAGPREWLALILSRFSPGLLNYLLRKLPTT
ncbi:MAG: SDR family oxidoreductase [Bacteroidetes bacterium]|nr:MAG: SDR family oxidoreductase [Bacteroidota bacterium]